MEARMTTRGDDEDRCCVPHAEPERADVPCTIDRDSETECADEDGYGFGV